MRAIKRRKKIIELIAESCLSVRTSPIDFAFLGGTGNRLKSKTTAKLKEKQTLTATVLHPLRTLTSDIFFLITDNLEERYQGTGFTVKKRQCKFTKERVKGNTQ
jgi:hypothetical protein